MATKKTAQQQAADDAAARARAAAALAMQRARSAPAAPTAPVAPVIPPLFDPAVEQQRLASTFNVQLADADAGYQRGQLAYNSGYDATGARNTANPYAQAQRLEDMWRRSQLGTNNSMAAQGQYFSGARLNAQATNDREYAQSSDALKRSTQDAYYGIGRNQLQSYASNSLGVSGGAYDSLRKSVYGS